MRCRTERRDRESGRAFERVVDHPLTVAQEEVSGHRDISKPVRSSGRDKLPERKKPSFEAIRDSADRVAYWENWPQSVPSARGWPPTARGREMPPPLRLLGFP